MFDISQSLLSKAGSWLFSPAFFLAGFAAVYACARSRLRETRSVDGLGTLCALSYFKAFSALLMIQSCALVVGGNPFAPIAITMRGPWICLLVASAVFYAIHRVLFKSMALRMREYSHAVTRTSDGFIFFVAGLMVLNGLLAASIEIGMSGGFRSENLSVAAIWSIAYILLSRRARKAIPAISDRAST